MSLVEKKRKSRTVLIAERVKEKVMDYLYTLYLTDEQLGIADAVLDIFIKFFEEELEKKEVKKA